MSATVPRPDPVLFAGVVGQGAAIAQLRAAARQPVHAHLLVGQPGLGQQILVRGFAAALLCPDGGCGACSTCRRTLAGIHPDLIEVHRSGAFLSVGDARRVLTAAQRRPVEGARQVIAVHEVHLAPAAAPALLKTLEEPPPATYFVLTAEFVPPELATIASRCSVIELPPVPPDVLEAALLAEGLTEDEARLYAAASSGSPERARLLARDKGVAARRALWHSVPARLDGTGTTIASLAAQLLASADEAAAPLKAAHEHEMEELAARAQAMGERVVPGRKEVEERHRREERRFRTDELRAGLAVLAAAYRERLETDSAPRWEARVSDVTAAVGWIRDASLALVRNPNETLLLEALLIRLSSDHGEVAATHR